MRAPTLAVIIVAATLATIGVNATTADAATAAPTKTRITGKTPDGFCPTTLAYLTDFPTSEHVTTRIKGHFSIQAWSKDSNVLATVNTSDRKHRKATVTKLKVNPSRVGHVEIVSAKTKHYAESDCYVSYKG